MKKVLAILLLLTTLVTCGFAEELDMSVPMHQYAANHGFSLGAAMSFTDLGKKFYTDYVKAHFNSITATNEMKAYSLLDQRASQASEDGMPRMNYTHADRIVGWAQQNGIGVRGHVLVWDAYMTEWFYHEDYDSQKPIASRDVLLARMESYISQVVAHFEEKFPGVVYCWDVVNEAVGDSASDSDRSDARHLRVTRGGTPNGFYQHVGPDYVEYAFLYARNAVEATGADIRLFYNDYNNFYADKRSGIVALVKSVNSFAKNEDGTARRLCDGIGMQGYVGGYGTQNGCMNQADLTRIAETIAMYGEMGLEVHVTELAVRNFEREKLQEHAEFYRDLFRVFKEANAGEIAPLTNVSIWGMCDNPFDNKNSYTYKMNGTYSGLIDYSYNYKEAFRLVYQELRAD